MAPEPAPQPPYELMRDRLQKGLVIPFLGAGASLLRDPRGANWRSPASGFLPKAGELAEYLDRRSAYPSNAPPELTRVAQYFEGVAGRQGLDDELREVFARGYRPGPLHIFLADSPCRVLVTTNYDCCSKRPSKTSEDLTITWSTATARPPCFTAATTATPAMQVRLSRWSPMNL
jgi:hypothetical protein